MTRPVCGSCLTCLELTHALLDSRDGGGPAGTWHPVFGREGEPKEPFFVPEPLTPELLARGAVSPRKRLRRVA